MRWYLSYLSSLTCERRVCQSSIWTIKWSLNLETNSHLSLLETNSLVTPWNRINMCTSWNEFVKSETCANSCTSTSRKGEPGVWGWLTCAEGNNVETISRSCQPAIGESIAQGQLIGAWEELSFGPTWGPCCQSISCHLHLPAVICSSIVCVHAVWCLVEGGRACWVWEQWRGGDWEENGRSELRAAFSGPECRVSHPFSICGSFVGPLWVLLWVLFQILVCSHEVRSGHPL